MTNTDFLQLFPEVQRPAKCLHDLILLTKYRKVDLHDLYSCLNDFSLDRANHRGYYENPAAYIWVVVNNSITHYKKNTEKWNFNPIDEIQETTDNIDFDKKHTEEKIRSFLNELLKIKLAPNQQKLISIITDLCIGNHSKHREFMDEVYNEASEIGISYNNVRQILRRLRSVLRQSGNDKSKNALYFGSENESVSNFIELLVSLSSPNDMSLASYRFSMLDLYMMKKINNLFETNGYSLGVFPEIYDVDLTNPNYSSPYDESFSETLPKKFQEEFTKNEEVFKELIDNLKGDKSGSIWDKNPGWSRNFIMEIFGMYIPKQTNEKCECGLKSREGVIYVFTDRIKLYAELIEDDCSRRDVIELYIRTCVLTHELAHWASHWGVTENGKRWDCNFYFNDDTQTACVKTHESLAQLITWWLVDWNEELKTVFENYLTPADDTNPYALYKNLTCFDESEIFNKLSIIRELCNASDKKMFYVLKDSIFGNLSKEAALKILQNIPN